MFIALAAFANGCSETQASADEPFNDVIQLIRESGYVITQTGTPSPIGQEVVQQLTAHQSGIMPQMLTLDNSLDVILAKHIELEGPATYTQWPHVFLMIRGAVIVPVHGDRKKWEQVVSSMHRHGAKYVERSHSAPVDVIRTLEHIRSMIENHRRSYLRLPDFSMQWLDLLDNDELSERSVRNCLADHPVSTLIKIIDVPGQSGAGISVKVAGWVWNSADSQMYPAGWTEEQLATVSQMIADLSLSSRLNQFNERRLPEMRTILGLWRGNITTWYVNNERVRYPTIDELRSHKILQPLLEKSANPFNASNEIQLADWRINQPLIGGDAGWNYDPKTGMIWANSDVAGENEI